MSTESGLKSRIQADINEALRSGDELLKSTLRMALAAIMNAEVAGAQATVLTDDQIINLLRSEVKKRAESAEIYAAAGRTELATKETQEMVIIETYLLDRWQQRWQLPPPRCSQEPLHPLLLEGTSR